MRNQRISRAPTYVNLYGYEYRNVYALHELEDVKDPRLSSFLLR